MRKLVVITCFFTFLQVSGQFEPVPADGIWYRDSDGDGYGNANFPRQSTTKPPGYAPNGLDCDDSDASVWREGLWYADVDGDGFGDPAVSQVSCHPPPGYVANKLDQCPDVFGELDGCPPPQPELGSTALSNQNYVFTRIYQEPLSSPQHVTRAEEVIEEVTYYDGLGRPMQQVAIHAGGDGSDLVTPIVYDAYGRQTRNYLAAPVDDGSPGSFRTTDMPAEVASYYHATFSEDFAGMAPSLSNPYSEQLLESSPLNRVLKQGAPGKDWALGSDHEVAFEYATNTTSEVRMYSVSLDASYTPSLVASGYYDAGQLFKTITYDQNHTDAASKDHTTQEFTDKQGRVVLRRRFEGEVPHDTYYVYDDYGNLTYVLPPKIVTSDGVSATELQELAYQYRYDHRNRLVERKIPGKGDAATWELIVYNKLDQPILTQDPNLREQGQWLFTKYDAFGRVVYTGLMTSSDSRDSLQAAADSFIVHYEQRASGTSSIGGTSVYYSNTAYPTAAITALHTIHYYDRYLPASAQAGISLPTTNHYGETITDKTKTLPTVSKIRVLGTNDWITRVTGYDQKGRSIWSREKNPYLDTDQLVESKLDFVGKVQASRSTHIKNSVSTIIQDTFTYDHMGRPLIHFQQLNNQPQELIVRNHYDELGQLVEKQVGGAVQGSGLQVVDYGYNVRGWLKQINDPGNLGTDLFGFGINYNDPEHGGTSLYDGNISETRWKTANDHTLRWYRYDYDALSRITDATAYSSHYNLSNVSYDKNGNITNLSRRGAINAAASSFGDMDILTYSYHPISNQLRSVNDAGSASYGFKDASSLATQYTYDPNGNLTSDANKGIIAITYNHLNLPTEIKFNNSSSRVVKYTYDATGVKLRKVIPEKTTDYAGGVVYENGSLQFLAHPEGYASHVNGQFTYNYNYLDHLGNVRLSYTDVNQHNTQPINIQIIQEKNYYPFGLAHRGYNGGVSSLGNDAAKRFGFGGKELQSESISGNILDWYDVSARNYDPAIGRWMVIDPLADDPEQVDKSPYAFAWNNPINYTDPTGMMAEPIYDEDGNHLGNTKEGFTGQVMIYSGDKDVDFSEMSADEAMAMDGVDTYDNQRGDLSGDAKSNIWTNIASQMEGQQIYDETFSISDLEGGKIHYDGKASGSWVSSYALGKGKGKIRGSDGYSYETTVENIQSSIGVHEYYSHIKKNQGGRYSSHRLAYKNVINYKSLWNNTTGAYKGFNMRMLLKYTKSETERTKVAPLYQNLYKNFEDKR